MFRNNEKMIAKNLNLFHCRLVCSRSHPELVSGSKSTEIQTLQSCSGDIWREINIESAFHLKAAFSIENNKTERNLPILFRRTIFQQVPSPASSYG